MLRQTQLPPYEYPTTNSTTKVGTSGIVLRAIARDAALSLSGGLLRAVVMNSKDAFARIQAGDYEGTRNVNGLERKSIFREYADAWRED
jgi:hypothetical protein